MNTLWPASEQFNLADHHFLLALGSPWGEEADRSLRAAGVVPRVSTAVEEAVQVLEFQQADFLLLAEGFGASDLKSYPLLEYIQTLSSASRRNFFVVLITPKLRSGDLWSAFSYSVNLVLQPDHLPEIFQRIGKSWTAWKDLYRIFLQNQD